jgi:hypothetical protein
MQAMRGGVMSTNVRELKDGYKLLYRDDMSGIEIVADAWLDASAQQRSGMETIEIPRELIIEMVTYYIKNRRSSRSEREIAALTFDDICEGK